MNYDNEFIIEQCVNEAVNANPGGTDIEILQAAYDRASRIYCDHIGTPSALEPGEAYDNIGSALYVLGRVHDIRGQVA